MLSELQMDKAAFDLWISAEGTDNHMELERVKRILSMILEECCTEIQRKYIRHYFVDQMAITEIAERYCINKSSVSRSIHAGLDKAYSYLRFCSPQFINAPKKRRYLGRLVNKRRRHIMDNWISAKDRLPEAFTPVIVCRKGCRAGGSYIVEQGYLDVNEWWKVYGTRTKSVTHWMPLPDPPDSLQ